MNFSPAAPIAADFGIREPFLMVARHIASAVRAAHARSKGRRAYRQMLLCEDHILRDIGVTRADVRQALRDLDCPN